MDQFPNIQIFGQEPLISDGHTLKMLMVLNQNMLMILDQVLDRQGGPRYPESP